MATPPPSSAERRRRRRRGSLERPVSARLYRATWSLVALPLLVAAFTVGRPQPLPPPALPPSFDQETAVELATYLAKTFPNRQPGGPDARAATAWVRARLADYHLSVEEQRFRTAIPGRGDVELVNLVARTPDTGQSRSPEAIVVVAHRDNSGLSPGANDNASGTAALIELARNLSTVSLAHSVVFVSLDGGAFGGLGAARLAASAAFRQNVLAVVDLDSLAGPGSPRLELTGDLPRSPSGTLLATAEASVYDQTGREPTHPAPHYQLLDLAFPFSLYDQAPFLAAGVSAVALTTAPSRPPAAAHDVPSQLDEDRLGELGRAVQALVASLDGAPEIARGTDSFVYLGGRFVRGFAIEFALLVALLPALVATVDLTARLRRRGAALGPALRSYRSRLGAWLWGGGLAALFTVAGAFPRNSSRPLAPDTEAAQSWPVAALVGLVLLSAVGWFVARTRLLPRRPATRSEELAGHLAAMLALCAVGVFMAATNPFSLLLVLPSLHAWLWVPHVRNSHPVLRLALYATGFLGPALLIASFAVRFRLGLDAPWYVASLFAGGYAPLSLFLAFLVWAPAAAQVGAILFGRYAPAPGPGAAPERGPIREAIRRTSRAAGQARRRLAGPAAAGPPPAPEGPSPRSPAAADERAGARPYGTGR